MREAGERLQGLEAEFPCASWLPVICQNPTEAPLVWSNPTQNPITVNSSQLSLRQIIPLVLTASLAITTAIVGARSFGLLENWELRAFDSMMRSRPDEGKDNRILIVKITEPDVQAQNADERGAASISDGALAKLIDKLEKYNPRIIGLNIYRDNPVKPKYANLAKWMKTSSKFIGVCQVSEGDENPGVPSPPESPQNLGFTDVVEDSDGILRRHLLAMTPAQPCNTDKSFSFQLAERYLAQENREFKLNPEENPKSGNNFALPYLEDNSGSYSNIDSLGYQIMLNWRSTREVATHVTLQDVLNNKIKPDLVRDKIVIIGTTAPSFNNYWSTSYSAATSPQKKTSGVVIHAHMVSQIISAVLDNRPLLWVWSKWTEALWIYCWAIVGGMLAWKTKSSLHLALTLGLTQIVLYFLCYTILIQGVWIPFIPSMFAFMVGSGSIATYRLKKQL